MHLESDTLSSTACILHHDHTISKLGIKKALTTTLISKDTGLRLYFVYLAN